MKRLLASFLILTVAVLPAQAATVISPLPNNIQNGQPADATKLMANFNQIVTNVNANAAALNATNIFTAPQQFPNGITTVQGATVGQVQNESLVFLGTAGGTANALTAAAAIAPLAYVAGQRWKVIAAAPNTGPVTININGLGLRTVAKFGGTPLVAGDIVAGQVVILEDDGTRLQMINNTIPSGIPYADAGGTANALTVTYILPAKNLTLVDGLDLTVGIAASNTSATVTLTPTMNGITSPTWNVVKFANNVEVALAPGDLQGDAWFKADVPNSKWVLMNPATVNTSAITLNTVGTGVIVAASGVMSIAASSVLSKFTVITASASFVPQTSTKTMVALCVGGGGNGGAGGSSQLQPIAQDGAGGAGGGAGQVAIGTASSVSGIYNAIVGGAGGTTSFGGTICSALGGASGQSGSLGGAATVGGRSGGQGAGGSPGGSSSGLSGGSGAAGSGGGIGGGGGGGAAPMFLYSGNAGNGGNGGNNNVGSPGTAASANSGAGGGGGGGAGGAAAAGGSGGAGGSGVILVWEYQ